LELGIGGIEAKQQFLPHLLIREDVRLSRVGLQRSP
jgi:hypothetical protein